jgi:predicted metal-dependent peptidase
MNHLVPAIDTSGSIGGEELNAFLSEFAAICEQVNPELIDLLYWDGEVAGHETYTGASAQSIISSTKPMGGGGTSPSCITAYMKEKSPVLWCIVGGNTVVAPNGKTIHVND